MKLLKKLNRIAVLMLIILASFAGSPIITGALNILAATLWIYMAEIMVWEGQLIRLIVENRKT